MSLDQEPESYETQPDQNGVKRVVEFSTNKEGQKVKITKLVKTVTYTKKVNKRVEERRKRWVKFGKCAQGGDSGLSYRGEEVHLVLGEDQRKQREQEEQEKRDKAVIDAMYQNFLQENSNRSGNTPTAVSMDPTNLPTAAWKPSWSKTGAGAPPSASTSTVQPTTEGRYVPPARRGPGRTMDSGPEERSVLHVFNISDDMTDNDLMSLFRPYGVVTRVFLVKDKYSGQSRGSAYVTFTNRPDAQRAMDELHGKGVDYLILGIEWAKPSGKM
eukprot:TRINITY_DN1458_c0_g1_i9.p1 TRINITY_DN1458_c0_g1~~TRINITY_DN1458_c0_g1_i9.p1  ORF type:complete len:271 (-),score=53.50 TRINITY_DN1458_c0_g1_i9:138-950(-)